MSRVHFLTGLLAIWPGRRLQGPIHRISRIFREATTNRRIEVMVRAQFNVPQDYNVVIGARKPSKIAGYDTLPVTLSRGTKSSQVEFLISTDGKTAGAP